MLTSPRFLILGLVIYKKSLSSLRRIAAIEKEKSKRPQKEKWIRMAFGQGIKNVYIYSLPFLVYIVKPLSFAKKSVGSF